MSFYLTEKELEKSCLIFQPDLYTVYKLTVKKTGQFYIGVTKDLKKRADNHLYMICCCIPNFSEGKALPFHIEAAKSFIVGNDDDYEVFKKGKLVRHGVDVQVLAVVVGEKYAYAVESMYIFDNSNEPLCLNFRK